MSNVASRVTPKLAATRPLTFFDHVKNVYYLVIKELRSIRADPVMLFLVLYSFSISVNTVATGAVTDPATRGFLADQIKAFAAFVRG